MASKRMPINPWNGSPSPSHGQKLAWQRLLSLSFHVSTAEQAGYLPPHGIAYCKGWTRSYCFVVVMLMAYENKDFLEALG